MTSYQLTLMTVLQAAVQDRRVTSAVVVAADSLDQYEVNRCLHRFSTEDRALFTVVTSDSGARALRGRHVFLTPETQGRLDFWRAVDKRLSAQGREIA